MRPIAMAGKWLIGRELVPIDTGNERRDDLDDTP